MPRKVNPTKKPATQADVEKAYDKGVHAGIRSANTIFLTVLLDKYGFEDRVIDFWEDVCKLSEEIAEHRVNMTDLTHVLLKEYHIKL